MVGFKLGVKNFNEFVIVFFTISTYLCFQNC